jgi:hypothetical protein
MSAVQFSSVTMSPFYVGPLSSSRVLRLQTERTASSYGGQWQLRIISRGQPTRDGPLTLVLSCG